MVHQLLALLTLIEKNLLAVHYHPSLERVRQSG